MPPSAHALAFRLIDQKHIIHIGTIPAVAVFHTHSVDRVRLQRRQQRTGCISGIR